MRPLRRFEEMGRVALALITRKLMGNKVDQPRPVNTPLRYVGNQWFLNERLVERAFVFSRLGPRGDGERVLDFGCTGSDLPLALAGMGYEVTGIDLRPYPFDHPNLDFIQTNILDWGGKPFDAIVAVSSLEHVGLDAYGQEPDSGELQKVADRLQDLLKPDGRLLLTVPFGRPYQDDFLRSFSEGEIDQLFEGLQTEKREFYRRDGHRYWHPCSMERASKVSNENRGMHGVNCVGCFDMRPVGPS